MNWSSIDTVLLDMDGTLLDLAFDSRFWLQRVPERYQAHSGLSADAATARFQAIFQEQQGTLNWYCTEFWSDALGFDVLALKSECARGEQGVCYRADAPEFLRFLKREGKRVVIVTNAHPDTVTVKHAITGVLTQVDAWYSSHQFGAAKEAGEFWGALRETLGYDPGRTLFVDDGEHILSAAEAHRIKHLVHVASPESGSPAVPSTRYRSIEHFAEIAPL